MRKIIGYKTAFRSIERFVEYAEGKLSAEDYSKTKENDEEQPIFAPPKQRKLLNWLAGLFK